MIRPIRTAPTPISTQAQAGRPLLFDCSGLVLAVGSTWTVAVLSVTDARTGRSLSRTRFGHGVGPRGPGDRLRLGRGDRAAARACARFRGRRSDNGGRPGGRDDAGERSAGGQRHGRPSEPGAFRDLTHRRLSPVCAPGATVRARLLMVCGHDAGRRASVPARRAGRPYCTGFLQRVRQSYAAEPVHRRLRAFEAVLC